MNRVRRETATFNPFGATKSITGDSGDDKWTWNVDGNHFLSGIKNSRDTKVALAHCASGISLTILFRQRFGAIAQSFEGPAVVHLADDFFLPRLGLCMKLIH